MFLEYDWTSCVYRARFGNTWTTINGWWIFPDMPTVKEQLALVGLKVGKKTDSRSWRIETI